MIIVLDLLIILSHGPHPNNQGGGRHNVPLWGRVVAVLLGTENILIKETKRVKKGQILIFLTLTQGLCYKSSKNSFWL